MTTRKDDLFIIIGDRVLSISELGPIADMKLDKAMQEIINQGFLGPGVQGQPWYEIIKSSEIKLEKIPLEDNILVHTLWTRYNDYLAECRKLSSLGQLTDQHKREIIRLRREWKTAEKLSNS